MKGIKSWPVCFIALALFLAGCTRIRYHEPAGVQTGTASWYGPGFHGRTTSNKEIYNMHDMTAAHQTLPFGTHVMVTNLRNGKSVIVRINDRGPFVKGRIIDLSYAAARILGMIGPGTAPVRIEVLPDLSPPPASQKFSVQVGAFADKSNAEALKKALNPSFKNVYIASFKTALKTYYRVRIRAKNRDRAEEIARRLSSLGYPVMILEEE